LFSQNTKKYCTFTPKFVIKGTSKIWVWEIGIRVRKKPIPDPGSRVQKAPDPGSGFATLNGGYNDNEEHYVPVVGHEVGLKLLQGVERELGPPDDLLGHVGRPGQQEVTICLSHTP
jgi:hypothetical protein